MSEKIENIMTKSLKYVNEALDDIKKQCRDIVIDDLLDEDYEEENNE